MDVLTLQVSSACEYSAAVWEGDVMSDKKFVRAAAFDRSGDVLEDIEGVHLRHLPQFTTLLVRTMNSWYRVVITRWPEVYVQGGAFFPDPTCAYLDGASRGVSLRTGWIGVDLSVEFRSGGQRIITSPVRAITIERPRTRSRISFLCAVRRTNRDWF